MQASGEEFNAVIIGVHDDDSVGGLYYTVQYSRGAGAAAGREETIEAQTTAARIRRRVGDDAPVAVVAPGAAAAAPANGGTDRAVPSTLAELNLLLGKARAAGDRKESIRMLICSTVRFLLRPPPLTLLSRPVSVRLTRRLVATCI